ncbi:hypothetical protein CMEL01_03848 [Colletotrichum melonis]|uniref:Uncharacterized protein n=1 Tax=Colletotrichum melonis TaxID=1209925 RepID=A0AAI9UDP6_9PEZI|nr:hypothetical protein CMEL01_03848 [Colletotrichum melonis]
MQSLYRHLGMPTLYRVEPLIALSLLLLVLPHFKLGSQSDHSALRLSARQAEWSGPRIGSPSIHDPFQHASAVVTAAARPARKRRKRDKVWCQ